MLMSSPQMAMPMSAVPVSMPAVQMPLMGFSNALLVPVTVVAVNLPSPSASPTIAKQSSLSSESETSLPLSRQSSESIDSELGEPLEGSISGRVWDLSQRSKGCRHVQASLDAASDAERAQLASELRGRIFAAARSACANYVLQKIIHVLRPQACQFIIDELMQDPQEVPALARHQYGCRILQRLLEHCQSQQMGGIIQLLLSEALSLVRHSYGTFVMQEIFDFGTEAQRRRLGEVLLGAGDLGNDESATQVLQKALLHAPQKVALARSLVPQFTHIARGRHSHHTVLAALPLLSQEDSERAIALLSSKVQKLWASRYGRLVVKAIPSLHQQCVGMTRREAANA